ncbi:MAG: SPFH domain-containing protein [Gammaproteobacteria bacterium]
MILRNVLDFLVPVLWLLLALGWLAYLWVVGRRNGILVALRRLFSRRLLAPLLILIAVSVASASLVFINPTEVGVVVSLLAPKGIREQPLKSGLHLIVPLAEQVVRYPIVWQSYTMSGREMEGDQLGDDAIKARTADGQLVIIDVTSLFHIDPEQVITLHIRWQNRYIEEYIRPALRAAVRREAAKYTVDEINSQKRQLFEQTLNEMIKEAAAAAGGGLVPENILLRNITFSNEYAQSVEQKQTALQGVTEAAYRAKQTANLANGDAEKIRIKARADADALLIQAEAEATARIVRARADAESLNLIGASLQNRPDLLTFRYIDKLSPNIKAMLLPSNAPMILPMPELNDEPHHQANMAKQGEAAAPAVPVDLTPAVMDKPTPVNAAPAAVAGPHALDQPAPVASPAPVPQQ